jgi:transaldolase
VVRLDDIGHDGFTIAEQIVKVFRNYSFSTEVLVASVRSPHHLLRAPEAGAHIAMLPCNVIKQMLKHPLSDIELENFLADWHKTRQWI